MRILAIATLCLALVACVPEPSNGVHNSAANQNPQGDCAPKTECEPARDTGE